MDAFNNIFIKIVHLFSLLLLSDVIIRDDRFCAYTHAVLFHHLIFFTAVSFPSTYTIAQWITAELS